MKDDLIIGIDGGGTHSKLVAVSGDGTVLGRLKGSRLNYNYNQNGLLLCQETLVKDIQQLLSLVGSTTFSTLSVGLSSCDEPIREGESIAFFKDLYPGRSCYLRGDLMMALLGATQGDPGAMIVSGTGMMGLGLDEQHNLHVIGGWGFLFGDPGSAYQVGIEGLKAAIAASEKLNRSTQLENRALRYFSIPSMRLMIPLLYDPLVPPGKLAGFAQDVLEAARMGDAAAAEIITRYLDALSNQAIHLIRSVNHWPSSLYIYGGMLEHNPDLVDRFSRAVMNQISNCWIGFPTLSPDIGAVLYPFFANGQVLPVGFLENLKKGAIS